MPAMYWLTYTDRMVPNVGQQVLQLYAADAKSMKRVDLNRAISNAKKRGVQRLRRKGVKPTVHSVRCVG